tara:strand:+ start:9692 stop:10126 length:435 start_codon:yes stop_codon:yes gene_type:complete
MPSLPRKKRKDNAPRSRNTSDSKKVYDKNKHKALSARYRKQQGLCENCLHYGILTDITPGRRKGSLDHIIPLTFGGSPDNPQNLMALCEGYNSCHREKSRLENKYKKPLIDSKKDKAGNQIPINRNHIFDKIGNPNDFKNEKTL